MHLMHIWVTDDSSIYFRSFAYSTECLGLHLGNPQTANTGDGRGWTNELAVIRYDFGGTLLGTCLESLTGEFLVSL